MEIYGAVVGKQKSDIQTAFAMVTIRAGGLAPFGTNMRNSLSSKIVKMMKIYFWRFSS